MNKLIDSALLITLFTAILYCAYSRYLIGYCVELGVNYFVVDKNINQVLFFGVHLLLSPLLYLFLSGLAGFSLLYVVLKWIKYGGLRRLIKNKIFLVKLNSKFISIYKYTDDFLEIRIIIKYFCILCFVLVIFVHASVYFQNLGSDNAKEFIKKVKDSEYNLNKITTTIDGKDKNLILIDCGNVKCIGFDYINKKMYYFQATNDFYTDEVKSKFF